MRYHRRMEHPDGPVPRLPRARGFKVPLPDLVRIATLATLLVAVVVMGPTCADTVSKLVMNVGEPVQDAGPTIERSDRLPGPASPDGGAWLPPNYELIRGDMTEEQIRAAIERARRSAR
jgi:hypothetical protein